MGFSSIASHQTKQAEYLIGTVVDNLDPKKQLRVRAHIPKMYEGKTETLPWISPKVNSSFGMGDNFGTCQVPAIGSRIKIKFQGGDHNFPIYEGYQASANLTLPEELTTNYPNRRGSISPSGVVDYQDETEGGVEIMKRHPSGAGFCITKDGRILIYAPKGIGIVAKDNVTLDLQGDARLVVSAKEILFKATNFICNIADSLLAQCKNVALLATDIASTGDWFHDGKITSSGDVKAGPISLINHKHRYTDDGHPAVSEKPLA